jgi:hypothetical protein
VGDTSIRLADVPVPKVWVAFWRSWAFPVAHARHHPIGAKLILSVKGEKTTSVSVLAI